MQRKWKHVTLPLSRYANVLCVHRTPDYCNYQLDSEPYTNDSLTHTLRITGKFYWCIMLCMGVWDVSMYHTIGA